jgi:hypothetical protein
MRVGGKDIEKKCFVNKLIFLLLPTLGLFHVVQLIKPGCTYDSVLVLKELQEGDMREDIQE